MDVKKAPNNHRSDLEQFDRNRYFYGKLMDVQQFQMETDYLNRKRRLINHHVFGYGVICGLNVLAGRCPNQLEVTPGLALDKWGRELIVNCRQVVTIPPETLEKAVRECGDEPVAKVHLELCYVECAGEPEPVYAGDCECAEPCESGSIRERFKLVVREGAAEGYAPHCKFPQVLAAGRMNYPALVRWTAEHGCPALAPDPCILLANIQLSEGERGHQCRHEDIDIGVRRIVFTNRLLADLMACVIKEESEEESDND